LNDVRKAMLKKKDLETKLKEIASDEISKETWRYLINHKTTMLEAKLKIAVEVLEKIKKAGWTREAEWARLALKEVKK